LQKTRYTRYLRYPAVITVPWQDPFSCRLLSGASRTAFRPVPAGRTCVQPGRRIVFSGWTCSQSWTQRRRGARTCARAVGRPCAQPGSRRIPTERPCAHCQRQRRRCHRRGPDAM